MSDGLPIRIVMIVCVFSLLLGLGIVKYVNINKHNANESKTTVEVTIVSAKHYERSIFRIPTYEVVVQYGDEIYYIEDKDTYYKYKDKVNKTVNATLIFCNYNSDFIEDETKIELP